MLEMPYLGNACSWEDALEESRAEGDVRSALLAFQSYMPNWGGWAAGAPLASRFFTGFQGKPREGVRFHEYLKTLVDVPHLGLVVRKGLGSKEWREFTSGVMTLEFCSAFRQAGHQVEFVKNEREKCPDARIQFADRWVTLEFKGLHKPDEQIPWDRLVDTLVTTLTRHGLGLHDFDIAFEPPALPHAEAITDCLMGIRPDQGWCALPFDSGRARRANEQGSFQLPFGQKDPLHRLVLKLNAWCKQLLRVEGPTLVVVRTDELFNFFDSKALAATASQTAESVRSSLATKGMIGGVLVYEEPFLAPLPRFNVDEGSFKLSAGGSPRGFARIAALVENPQASIPLAAAETRGLIGPGMIW